MTVTAFNMISIIDLCVVWLEGKWTRLFSIDGRQNPIRVVGRVHEPNVSLYIDQWRWRETASCANLASAANSTVRSMELMKQTYLT